MLADCHNVSDLQNLVSRVRPHIPEQPCSLQCNKPSQQCISCPLIARDLLTPSFRIRAPPYICNPAPPPSPNQASCSPASTNSALCSNNKTTKGWVGGKSIAVAA